MFFNSSEDRLNEFIMIMILSVLQIDLQFEQIAHEIAMQHPDLVVPAFRFPLTYPPLLVDLAQRFMTSDAIRHGNIAAGTNTWLMGNRDFRRINPTKLGMAVIATIGIGGQLSNVARPAVFATDLFDGHTHTSADGWFACFPASGWSLP
jgi:hypothetical protein